MKSQKKFILLLTVLAIMTSFSLSTYADGPNPPTVPGEHGAAGNVPVGAPIDGGITILLLLGAGYGAKKLYCARKVDNPVESPDNQTL